MIVVTGATGNVGRSLVEQLLAAGAPVRALTRDPARAALPAGAAVERAAFGAGEVLDPLFAGAEAVFLNLSAVGPDAGRVLDAAVAAGVRRVVLLSSTTVTDTPADREDAIAARHAAVEDAIRASGLEWTFVRGGMFATNALSWYAPQIRAGDVVRGPYAEAAAAPVHEADLAAVAAAALLDRDGTHRSAVYRVTGPRALTAAGQVRTIGEAIGRDLRFEELPRQDAVRQMTAQGMPPQFAESLLDAFAAMVGSEPEITHDTERVTGRPGLDYARWAADHAADFAAR